MLRSSLWMGRWFGTEVRVHVSFALLLLLAGVWGASVADSVLRGVGLFLALLLAVAVREGARVLAAIYAGFTPRTIFILPVGSMMALGSTEDASAATKRSLLWAAPAANAVVGFVLLGLSYGSTPGVPLLAAPWISPGHVLRSLVWTQFVMALVGLLPAPGASLKAPNALPAGAGLMTGLAMASVVAGMLTQNIWLVGLGAVALLMGFVRAAAAGTNGQVMSTAAAESVKVRDVMLTDSIFLSTSDTLSDALARAVHSLQDVFPVLRGDRLVGSISRQTVVQNMRADGNGYVQGLMTRNLQTAQPDEPVIEALRRAAAQGASEFLPVVSGGRMLGMLTPQSLGRAVEQVQTTRRDASREDSGE